MAWVFPSMVAGFLEGACWASEWKPCGLPVPSLGVAHEMTWCSSVYEANSNVAPRPCCLSLPPPGPSSLPSLSSRFLSEDVLLGRGGARVRSAVSLPHACPSHPCQLPGAPSPASRCHSRKCHLSLVAAPQTSGKSTTLTEKGASRFTAHVRTTLTSQLHQR